MHFSLPSIKRSAAPEGFDLITARSAEVASREEPPNMHLIDGREKRI